MNYSESIKGPLTKYKKEILYQGILNKLSDKCKIAFDKLNRMTLDEWNEHSFDVINIIASFKNYEELKNCPDNYIMAMGLDIANWPIFLEDKEFAFEISKMYKENLDTLPAERKIYLSMAFDIFKKEYPELFN